MLSMTGFGSAERVLNECDIFVDVKSVNSRYLDFKPRFSRELSPLEGDVKFLVQERLSRGRIDVFIELRMTLADQLELNQSVLKNFLALSEEIKGMDVEGDITVSDLLSAPGVVVSKQAGLSDSVQKVVLEVVGEALDELVASRKREGQAILAELRERITLLRKQVDQIRKFADKVGDYYREKLETRVKEVLSEVGVDESRLAQEVAYYVERSDISEELVRLMSHIDQFQGYLSDESGQPVGKKLDFLCQELNREVNTVLAKVSLVEISEVGVEVKAHVEALREQVQNVE